MSEIALITTSPFYGLEQINEVTIPSLISQTCQDFTWYYLDGYYKTNKQFFLELQDKVKFKIVHTPLLHATHYPHDFKWEPYNSALLLIEEDKFLRFGRFRKYHPCAVDICLDNIKTDVTVDFNQIVINNRTNYDEQFEFLIPISNVNYFHSSCGMFAAYKEPFIYETNGNDEVGLHWFHYEDVEMNLRCRQSSFKTITVNGGLYRYLHCKLFRLQPDLDPPVCQVATNHDSIFVLRYCGGVDIWNNGLKEHLQGLNHITEIHYNGFLFFKSLYDNSLIVSSGDGYRDWVGDNIKSIIGLNSELYGRNISKIYDDAKKLDINSKIELICNSHTEPKYYAE